MQNGYVIWNMECSRSLYRTGSLKTVASELVDYKLGVVEVQEVGWVEGGSQPADDYRFFCGDGNANDHLGTEFFLRKGIISGVKMVEFIRIGCRM